MTKNKVAVGVENKGKIRIIFNILFKNLFQNLKQGVLDRSSFGMRIILKQS
jgi:phage head maturation protease